MKFKVLLMLMYIASITTSMGGSKKVTTIDKKFLLANTFKFECYSEIKFIDESKYTINWATEGVYWNQEGKYTIAGEKILLHPKKCDDFSETNDCTQYMGEAICAIIEKDGQKYLHAKSVNNKKLMETEDFIDYLVWDKNTDICAKIKVLHANADGTTEIDGKWVDTQDPNNIIQFKNGQQFYLDERGMPNDVTDCIFKISTIEMPYDCIVDENIKSLKSGKYLNSNNMYGVSRSEYKLTGNILRIKYSCEFVEYKPYNNELSVNAEAVDANFLMENKFVILNSDYTYTLTFTSEDIYNLDYSEKTGEGDYSVLGKYEINENTINLRPYKCFRGGEEIEFGDKTWGFANCTLHNSECVISYDGFGESTTYTKYLEIEIQDDGTVKKMGVEACEKK